MLKKWTFNKQFKKAYRSLLSPRYWSRWKIKKQKDLTLFQSYQKEMDNYLKAISATDRRYMIDYLELRALQYHRKNMEFMDEHDLTVNRARLFELINLKQAIEKSLEKQKVELADEITPVV